MYVYIFWFKNLKYTNVPRLLLGVCSWPPGLGKQLSFNNASRVILLEMCHQFLGVNEISPKFCTEMNG